MTVYGHSTPAITDETLAIDGEIGRGDWIRAKRGASRATPETVVPTTTEPKVKEWSGRLDSNQRPLGPEPSALPG